MKKEASYLDQYNHIDKLIEEYKKSTAKDISDFVREQPKSTKKTFSDNYPIY